MSTPNIKQGLIEELIRFKNNVRTNPTGFSQTDRHRAGFISSTIDNLPERVMDILPDAILNTLDAFFRKFNRAVEFAINDPEATTPEEIGDYQSKLEDLYTYVISITPEINFHLNSLTQSFILRLLH